MDLLIRCSQQQLILSLLNDTKSVNPKSVSSSSSSSSSSISRCCEVSHIVKMDACLFERLFVQPQSHPKTKEGEGKEKVRRRRWVSMSDIQGNAIHVLDVEEEEENSIDLIGGGEEKIVRVLRSRS